MPKYRFLPHPDGERFDSVTIDTVERWKESELSGDEWRFSYRIKFWSHGEVRAELGAASIQDACLTAAYNFDRVKTEGGFLCDLEEVCCQPGCPNPWVALLHPVNRFSDAGEALVRGYSDGSSEWSPMEVRGFCQRHRRRGDCGLDDADPNYVLVEER